VREGTLSTEDIISIVARYFVRYKIIQELVFKAAVARTRLDEEPGSILTINKRRSKAVSKKTVQGKR
jgi:hypothetical protein